MVDSITTQLPNGRLVNPDNHDFIAELVRGVKESFKTKINLSTMGPFEGVVYGIDEGDTWEYPGDDDERYRRAHSAKISSKVKIYDK